MDDTLVMKFAKPFQDSTDNSLASTGITFIDMILYLLFEVFAVIEFHDQEEAALGILTHELSVCQVTAPRTVLAGNQGLVTEEQRLMRVGFALDTLNQDLLLRRFLLQPGRRNDTHGSLIFKFLFAPKGVAAPLVVFQFKGTLVGMLLRHVFVGIKRR